MKRKSLADDLASLLAPPASHEEELDDLGDGALARVPEDDYTIEKDTMVGLKRARHAKEEKRMLADIVLEGDAYRGRKSSRAKVFGEEGEEEEEEVKEEEDDAEDKGEDDEQDDDSDDGEEGEEEEEEEEEDRDPFSGTEAPVRSLDALEREYAQSLEEEADAMAALRQRGEKEKAKGRAVSHQLSLYDRSLESRVLLQRTLQGSLRLPLPSEQERTSSHVTGKEDDESVRKAKVAFAALREEALLTLDALISLEATLISRNDAISAPLSIRSLAQGGSVRSSSPMNCQSIEAVWENMENLKTTSLHFVDSALDRWHRRAVVVSSLGSAAKGGSSHLRALNQSISSQVASMMRDSTKLVQRARIAEENCPRPFGSKESTSRSLWSESSFDDGEFYQQLLREYLSRSNEEGMLGTGKVFAKKRKLVDRRASKGRKIRYHVHDKMVNFMTRFEADVPPFAIQLFANLFN